jgi:hypothetical protein
MSKADIRSDVLLDLLDEIGIKLTREQADSVSDDFAGHLECEREMESYQFMGPRVCDGCESLKRRVAKLENELESAYSSGEKAVKRILNIHPADNIRIDEFGGIEMVR